MTTIMPGGELPTGPAPAGRRPDRGWAGVRRTGRVAVRSAAVLALLAGAATAAGLTGSTPALAATSSSTHLTVDPTCVDGVCAQTFTTSGYFTTNDLTDIDASDGIYFTAVGGAGGDADEGGVGGPGGEAGISYSIPSSWDGYATFQVQIGGDGGNGNNGSVLGAPGGGGAGGGASGGNGTFSYYEADGYEAGGGGGGGGATTVYAADSQVVNSGDETLVDLAPGGGGAAPGFNGGGFPGEPDGEGPQVQQDGSYTTGYGPAFCGGAGGGANQAGCSYGPAWNGQAGSTTDGDGGTGASYQESSCTAQGNCPYVWGPGAGGGGGGEPGGGGGGIQQVNISSNSIPESGSGGMGGWGPLDSTHILGSNLPPEVIVTWTEVPQPTQTTLSLSQPTVQAGSGTSVTATAQVSMPASGTAPAGSVQFAINGWGIGAPVAVNGNSEASITLPAMAPGNQQITASYIPPGSWLEASSSGSEQVTVDGGTSVNFEVPGSQGPMVLEVNGTDGNTDIWQWDSQSAGGSASVNQQWAWVADGNSSYGWLVNEWTGQCLEVNGTTGAVDTFPFVSGAANELWQMVPGPSGQQGIYLQAESSGDYLTLDSGTVANGLQLTMSPAETSQGLWELNQDGISWPAS